MTLRDWILWVALFIGVMVWSRHDRSFGGMPAADADTDLAPSLEEQLLEDLGMQGFAGKVQKEVFSRDAGRSERTDWPPDEGHASGEDTKELDRQGLRELGEAAVQERHPLLEIALQMRLVEGMIRQSESGPTTQGIQQDIVERLEELLEQARKRCQAAQPSEDDQSQAASQELAARSQKKESSAGGGKSDSRPVRDPDAAPGKSDARRFQLHQVRNMLQSLDVWGELPERARRQMLEFPVEHFLPKYELLIEAYFRSLAEQEEKGTRGP